MPSVGQVVEFVQALAPLRLAASWDNVGLLLGDRSWQASRVMTCLTLTTEVAREAVERQCGLVITHHPILFKAVKRLTGDEWQGRAVLELAAARAAVYSAHTAYDDCAGGINEQLAQVLGLTEVRPLRTATEEPQFKLVVFVPRENLRHVQEAVWSAGAGIIGQYDCCSFAAEGSGTFRGSAAARPAVGQPQVLEEVAEARLELICPAGKLASAIEQLRRAHPYEEPAIDVYRLESSPGQSAAAGAGRVGMLPAQASGTSMNLAQFANLVSKSLAAGAVALAGDPAAVVKKVAIACGAGSEFLDEACAQRCDVLLTGEARFHTCVEARARGVGLVLAGHYATERPAVEWLARRLNGQFEGLVAWASHAERDPLQWLALTPAAS